MAFAALGSAFDLARRDTSKINPFASIVQEILLISDIFKYLARTGV
jgi:hypothetical protein